MDMSGVAAAPAKRKMKQCLHCFAAISARNDVAKELPGSGLDHLYILASPALPGICKVGRGHDPQARASELCEGMPFFLLLWNVFWGRGKEETVAHQALNSYRIREVPGVEWFRLRPEDACTIVARAIGPGWTPPSGDTTVVFERAPQQ